MRVIILLFFLFGISELLYSGAASLTFSPDNPSVGQTVTFTTNCAVTLEFDPMDGTGPFNVNSNSFQYTYNSPNTYMPQFRCQGQMNFVTPSIRRASDNLPASFIITATNPIPTLDEWGLILLGIIILGVGLVSMRQKRVVATIE